jgi:hypothetical protein
MVSNKLRFPALSLAAARSSSRRARQRFNIQTLLSS